MWEDTQSTEEWIEMSQLGLRIMLGFAAYDDIEVTLRESSITQRVLLQLTPVISIEGHLTLLESFR